MNERPAAEQLIARCESGALDPKEVLSNILFNWMSADEARDFVEAEYDIVI